MESRKPIYFLRMNPWGWKRASLPKLKASLQKIGSENSPDRERCLAMTWSQRNRYLNASILQRQERCWEEETGVKPGDSYFTLIVPIYNEENSLPSFLGTLMLSDVSSTVNMQVIFVSNACTDMSVDILRAFLSDLGNVETRDVVGEFTDQSMDRCCAVVERDHFTCIHINTSTAGKANALRIGNTIAYRSGHLITMSIDANNFIEPDAIRIMFSHAHRAFRGKPEPHDTVLYSGVGRESVKGSKGEGLLAKISTNRRHLVEAGGAGEGGVGGAMVAWNTKWMNDLEGPPQVALEDYAMGVLARINNFKIELAEGANIWVYIVNDFRGLLNTRARHVRGKRQLCDYVNHDQSIVSFIENEAYYMKKFRLRLKHLFDRIVDDPLSVVRYTATFLLWEWAIWKAMRDYKRDPKNQSWEKISSTY